MAMALIPLAGMVGGGVDISRMYIVKTRLQHACDAGALAGRKAMGGGTWAQSNNMPKTTADRFFTANYNREAYGVKTVTSAFTESAGKVTGSASAVLPMTLMKIFGRTTETLSVTCEAEMRLPNTDVMFVLDNTGSMAWCPNGTTSCNGDANSRIAGLRVAVKCFYEIVARLDTNATCTTGTPSGGTGSATQIRFGFVPYSMNVNVGRLLPNNYFPDNWHYQTRRANWNPPGTTVNGPYWEVYSGSISKDNCKKFVANESFTGFTKTALTSGTAPSPTTVTSFPDTNLDEGGSGGEWSWTNAPDTDGTNRSCRRKRTDEVTTHVPAFRDWTYGELDVNIAGLKAGGTNWNSSITLPIGNNGVDKVVNWEGCIEERDTVQASSYSPIPSGASDLDVDTVPNGLATQWKPALPGLIWYRQKTGNNWAGLDRAEVTTTTNYSSGPSAGCPTEARKLQAWPTASAFDTYVDSLDPVGTTYHDIGMIWGARLMSPTGIFASENAFTPEGGEIERHMIYMTDGIAQANPCDYSAYGIAWFDRRTTNNVGTAANCPNESSDLDSEINKRLSAMCTVVKNQNITLWVIAFGSSIDNTTKTRLSNCASANRYFSATDSAALQQTFADIANQISALRLTN